MQTQKLKESLTNAITTASKVSDLLWKVNEIIDQLSAQSPKIGENYPIKDLHHDDISDEIEKIESTDYISKVQPYINTVSFLSVARNYLDKAYNECPYPDNHYYTEAISEHRKALQKLEQLISNETENL